jgi:cell division protease FtsH
VPLAGDVDARTIARGTPGFSGADLANLVNEAALLAARNNKSVVGMGELESAKDKVLMGAERRSMVMTDKEKELTAYHEAGHALVGLHMPQSDPLHKVTIIPRGRALGVTMNLPERDKYGHTLTELTSKIAMMFGGRMAEELIFGKENVTTGASSDIQQATAIARRMVTEFGMSDKLGRVRYNANEQEIFLGHSVTQQQNVSEATAQLIDTEVRRLIEEAETKARKILTTQLDDLHKIAKALLEYETLTGEEASRLSALKIMSRPPRLHQAASAARYPPQARLKEARDLPRPRRPRAR